MAPPSRTATRFGKHISPQQQQQQQAQQQHAQPQQQQQQYAQQQEQGHRTGGGASGGATSPLPPVVESEEMTLRAALPAEGGLDEEELDTLKEVEERLESNKVQLEYKDRKIVSIQQEVDAWAEKRRLKQRRDGGGSGGSSGSAGSGGDGGGSGGQASREQGKGQGASRGKRPEVGEAQMIEELESGLSDLKGAKGIIRVLFSSLVAARRGLKQKTGAAKGFQVRVQLYFCLGGGEVVVFFFGANPSCARSLNNVGVQFLRVARSLPPPKRLAVRWTWRLLGYFVGFVEKGGLGGMLGFFFQGRQDSRTLLPGAYSAMCSREFGI